MYPTTGKSSLAGSDDFTSPDKHADKTSADDDADKTVKKQGAGHSKLEINPDSTGIDTDADKTKKEISKPPFKKVNSTIK